MTRIALDLGRARRGGRGRRRAAPSRGSGRASRPSTRDARTRPAPRRSSSSPRARGPRRPSRSAAPAMKSATTASTEIPSPRSRSRLAGRDEARREPARPRLAVELERDRHLPDRAVGADREHDLRRQLEVRAGRDVRDPSGGRRRSRSSTPCRAASAHQLVVVARNSCRPVLDVRARARSPSSAAHATRAGSARPGSRRRRAPSSGRSTSASSTVADDRERRPRSRPPGSSRGCATTGRSPVARARRAIVLP